MGMDNNTTTTRKDEAMKITDKEIREYLGHNGHECKIRITEDGDVYRYGHRDPMDRSSDYWAWMGKRNEIAEEIETELKMRSES